MKYVIEQEFNGKPECVKCLFGRYTGKNLDDESIMQCQAISNAPRCPEFEGCRKDCPLKLLENSH